MEGAFAANWSAEAVNGSAAPPGTEGNRTAGPPQRNEALARVEVAVLCLILFLALSGNACVLLALRTTRHKHSRLFFFMKHLSIADLVVAVFQVLPQLLWDITFRFYGPDLLCRLVKYLQVVGMFASTYLLLLMSLDRCLAICQPLRSLSRRTDRLAVLVTWLGCLVASAPQVHIFSLREVADGVFDCWAVFIQPWGPKAYITWITLAVYIVPVIVLATCYGLISFKIWQNLRLKTAAAAAEAAAGAEGEAADWAGRAILARVSNVKLISKAKIRTVKMTFIVVLAFIVCWTPFFFVQMWSVWDADAPKEASPFIIAMLLASLNSCCNPWIYMLFTGHLFQELVQRFLCCSFRRLKGSRPGETSVSKKSNSSTFVLSQYSSSQRRCSQPSTL
ncbi:oxytocin receptor [Bos indicus]|uniref:Oxytocin receptor n=5 Tax=Bovinae TaxID=27592 RepID=OXYR_BOVIN|nr:oxytocin receptor [Bos taurus]XP_010826715.1 PREDICTED: oxytocin receptor [Bison bison bison]XP_027378858.1 oxytocin receptor [Bos indicus x Bos taurus]XP_061252328.1 oxytocin receptor [Bos javanicus]P56449.1 RecName: Full=Oxytocin receptor; Short=OT-R [Bos taurus]AAC70786.1 oxytocin receptor [Bos taurus]DAA17124.1 TPA: oxytocin receptor [Bos taurus]